MAFDSKTGNLPLYTDIVETAPYTIAVGQTETPIINLEGLILLKIAVPSSLIGTVLSFKVDSDLTIANLKEYIKTDGTTVEITVTPDKVVGIVPQDFAGVKYIQIVSDATQTGTGAIFNLTVRRV